VSRSAVADAPKSQAAPAPIRTSPAPRFEVRAPESRPDEIHPGAEDVVSVDVPPQYNATELLRNIHYPEDARRDGITGRVLVRVLINRSGSVLRRIVEYSSNHSLDTAAVNAVAATKFIPAKSGGVAVATWITVPVTFSLEASATERRTY
jgi:protein TonB